ncbi:Pol protein [Phytophthora palmivora]|uniref:Pol protein n=1 Tax=Phytophthora palmivora TaxID=4796 RepID=A0A2P4YHH1_9STRA|nr:Pol protein [Phytophthora palmivora]
MTYFWRRMISTYRQPFCDNAFQMVSQTFRWPRMYKWVAHYIKTCERCQRVKPSSHASAPLQSLPVPADCWKSMSLRFVFGLPADDKSNTGILVFVCRLSKMVHLAPVCDKDTGKQAVQLFPDSVFRYHGLPETIVSDRDPRFTGAFWDTLFQLLGTKLMMSTANHRQTERANRVLEDTLGASVLRHLSPVCTQQCGTRINGVYPVLLEWVKTPQVPLTLRGGAVASIVNGREARKVFSSQVSEIEPEPLKRQLSSFIDDRLTLTSRVRDAMASAQDKQKEFSNKKGRGNLTVLNKVSSVGSDKLQPRFIGPFAVLARHGAAYTIDLPKSMNDGVRDDRQFQLVLQSMKVLGFTDVEQGAIWKILSALLHLGNVLFVTSSEDEGEEDNGTASAPLSALTTRKISVGGETFHSNLSLAQCGDARPQGPPACQPERQPDHQAQAQGLSRSRKHNLKADGPRRLTGTPQSPDPKLRYQFIQDILLTEQQAHIQEGIKWNAVDYEDN